MPGGRTPEYCVNPGSSVVPIETTPPPDFQPGVLGTNTESSVPSQNDNILGVENTNCTNHWLPILFIVAFFVNLIYLKYFRKSKFTPFLISLIAFLVDKYILQSRCCFGPDWFCHYFWVGNILSLIIPIFLKSKIKGNKIK